MSTALELYRPARLWCNLRHAWSVARPLDRLRAAIATSLARRALRRAEAELLSLSDHTLKDIGLTRGEICSVLGDAAQERRTRAAAVAPADWPSRNALRAAAPAATKACCGGPATSDATACCVADEVSKAAGEAGCGCRANAQLARAA